MAFLTNPTQQLSLDDSYHHLTTREKKWLDKSWAKAFGDTIFPLINEEHFRPLYSDCPSSRPNTPVNILVGALLLKELLRLTDEETVESLLFDVRFQYALHTTSFQEQPLSDRSFSRFRLRCYQYAQETGIDLVEQEMRSLSGQLADLLNLSSSLRRMDSFMISANIRSMSRLELAYTLGPGPYTYLTRRKVEKPKRGAD